MLAKNHIPTGLASGVFVYSGLHWYQSNILPDYVDNDGFIDNIAHYPINTLIDNMLINKWVGLVLGVILVIFGSLLPDIDNEKSTLGRYFRLPLRHRGLTNSLWAILLLGAVSLFVPLVGWVFVGYLTHVLLDGLSTAGWVPFYPLGKYKVINRGGVNMVVSDRYSGIYRVGYGMEYVLAVIWVVMMIGLSWWLFY